MSHWEVTDQQGMDLSKTCLKDGIRGNCSGCNHFHSPAPREKTGLELGINVLLASVWELKRDCCGSRQRKPWKFLALGHPQAEEAMEIPGSGSPSTLRGREGPCCPQGFQFRIRALTPSWGRCSFPELQDVGAEGNSSLDPRQEWVKCSAQGPRGLRRRNRGMKALRTCCEVEMSPALSRRGTDVPTPPLPSNPCSLWLLSLPAERREPGSYLDHCPMAGHHKELLGTGETCQALEASKLC